MAGTSFRFGATNIRTDPQPLPLPELPPGSEGDVDPLGHAVWLRFETINLGEEAIAVLQRFRLELSPLSSDRCLAFAAIHHAMRVATRGHLGDLRCPHA